MSDTYLRIQKQLGSDPGKRMKENQTPAELFRQVVSNIFQLKFARLVKLCGAHCGALRTLGCLLTAWLGSSVASVAVAICCEFRPFSTQVGTDMINFGPGLYEVKQNTDCERSNIEASFKNSSSDMIGS